ncbi:MAG: hypothetical protein WC485_09120 [Opitutaceae bacterium]
MKTFPRRLLLLAAAGWGLIGIPPAASAGGPDPIFEKTAPMTMAELAGRKTDGVSAFEVKDYAPGHYTGALSPSPTHADLNPKKAVIVVWKDSPLRFVFSHEASYCPWLELTNGSAMCDQFFEGNLGDAELFNDNGRRERNSFVDIIQSGPQRVWVRWTYFCVNAKDDTKPRLRGTEDYFAYPNGLVLRRMTYESLMPDEVVGYSTQPVECFGVAPVGSVIKDLVLSDTEHGDAHVFAVLDLYRDRQYDIFWDQQGNVRRRGNDATLADIYHSPGYALVIPFREKLLFAVLGKASGFSAENNCLVDHSTPGAQGGVGWGQGIWDHWPIGWLNSQGSDWKPGSPYTYHFGSIGQFFIPNGKSLVSFWRDYSEYCKDMAFNRWTERRVFYVLLGSASDWETIRRIGKGWLDQGGGCARPESIANLK